MAETKPKFSVILSPNKGFSGLRLAKNGMLKVMFHDGESQELDPKDAEAFLNEYPAYQLKK